MNYITIQEAAEKWGLKDRRVQVMCQEERIPGVKRFVSGENGVVTSEQSVKSLHFIMKITMAILSRSSIHRG